MTFLLEHLPPLVHVVISTRADPILQLSRLRARGELVEVRAADLRFTPEETAEYFRGVPGVDLDKVDVDALSQRTEGWIAALQLAGVSLRGRSDVAEFIARFAGDDRYILDYLLEEVLAQQPAEIRSFLLHSAILDQLSGPLCDAVLGTSAASSGMRGDNMLAVLERENLFLIPLDEKRRWYRYHLLFAEMLHARLLSEEPELMPLLHGRASLWFAEQGMPSEAIGHALAARNFDRAAHLMEMAAPQIRRDRSDALFQGWLKDLPRESVRRSPVLTVFQACNLMTAGKLDDVEPYLQEAERTIAAAPIGAESPWAEVAEFQRLPATIAIYRASMAQARGDDAGTVEYAQQALALARPGDHLTRGAASGFLGLSAWARGDISTALSTFTASVASLRAADNVIDELGGTVVLADLWRSAARPTKARQLLHSALKTAQTQGLPVARAMAELHVALSELDCESGDLDSARLHIETAAGLQEHAPLTESRYRWFVASALLAWAEGAPERALDLLEQAEPLYRRGFFPNVRPIPALRARIYISQGKLLDAGDWAHDQGVTVTDQPNFPNEFDHLTLVRLLVAQHRAQPHSGAAAQAQALLEKHLVSATESGRTGSLIEIRLLLALVHEAQGQPSKAREFVDQVIAEAPEADAYLWLLRTEGKVWTEGSGRTPMAGRREGANPPERQDPASNISVLSERERQVLRLLGGELSGPQIARELFISYNTLRSHTKHIFTKLGVTDRRAAVRLARESGLI
ncbi:LuxR C-terminal-related transcriptional regulator [Arthrobacter alpinus]|uniref:LuxR C-terminal-related transcriptional regulator n=1 Tax=Arthrobacter alpinus TaxID=656366 RepID=UPI001364C50D|nr:LuxR C-terminal-related transcriptional regulator [Arthrobacter alpinus]